MGVHTALALIEENVAAPDRRRPHRRHCDQFSIFNGGLHAGSYSPELDAIPTAQQLASDLVKHRE